MRVVQVLFMHEWQQGHQVRNCVCEGMGESVGALPYCVLVCRENVSEARTTTQRSRLSPTALSSTRQTSLAAAWRNVSPGSRRRCC